MAIVSWIIAAVCVLTFLWQLVEGTAIGGGGDFIHREERPGQFWFLIAIEALVITVGVLANAIL